jgi:hypothetical protein
MERIAIVAQLKKGSQARAAELIAAGPPFDLAETGIVRHSIYLSASEVVFVFEGHQVEWPLGDLIDKRPYPLGPALEQWRAIVDGPPRIARERFGWDAQDAVPPAAEAMAGSAR